MGLKKYRSVEDMPGPPPRRALDPENLRIALGMMELARRLSPLSRVPGVRKFRSFDQMIQQLEQQKAESAGPCPPRD